jgi:hypothetical protein
MFSNELLPSSNEIILKNTVKEAYGNELSWTNITFFDKMYLHFLMVAYFFTELKKLKGYELS